MATNRAETNHQASLYSLGKVSAVGSRHLAQINLARMRGPLTHPIMAGFVDQLDAVNALADAAPGFVWRLKGHGLSTPDDAALDYVAESILVNLSVWEDVQSLQRYVYHSAHGALLRHRREWFEKMEERWVALWWVPAGYHPTVAEGKERVDHLRTHGLTSYAFNFKQTFPPSPAHFPTNFS